MNQKKSLVLKYFPVNNKPDERFLLIFHQNTVNKDFFTSETEFLFVNSIDKYSIFGYIDDDFKINDVFEFIMEYPEASQYGHWTQNTNPIHATPNQDVGCQEINSTWKKEPSFVGLHQSNRKEAFLEGTDRLGSNNEECWYYAIGQKTAWNQNILPSFYLSALTFPIHEVFLWLRINDTSLLSKIKFSATYHPPFYFRHKCFISAAFYIFLIEE